MSQFLVLPKNRMAAFVGLLSEEHEVIAPVRGRGAVQLAPVARAGEMAHYVGPAATPPKRFLHRPVERLLSAVGSGSSHQFLEEELLPPKQALFALRPCDMHAILYLDRVFGSDFPDPIYQARRQHTLFVPLNCTEVAENCHCTSYGTGPELKEGFDLLLTNLGDRYLLEVGSERGRPLAEALELRRAGEKELALKARRLATAADQIARRVDTIGLPRLLSQGFRHPYWAQVTADCLSCGNCTMVCPTCYCYNVVEEVPVTADRAERVRHWDSCQLLGFAAVHGANFRPEREARLKQFIYHKLAYSLTQYGSFGCVGCGRCISWCPAAIDYIKVVQNLSEEA